MSDCEKMASAIDEILEASFFDPCNGDCLAPNEKIIDCTDGCYFYHRKGKFCLVHEFLKAVQLMEENYG